MKTVGDFKEAGLVFVADDVVSTSRSGRGNFERVEDDYVGFVNSTSGIHSLWNNAEVKEFAWRENTGVKPGFSGKIDFVHQDGEEFFGLDIEKACACEYWALNSGQGTIVKWRPHIPSIQTETSEEKECLDAIQDKHMWDDTAIKPVYTQEMADAGELPPVGVTCEFEADGEWRECYIVGMDQGDYLPVIQSYEDVFIMPQEGLNFRPIDTRTEREKAIDEMLKFMDYPNDEAYSVCESLYDAGYRKGK